MPVSQSYTVYGITNIKLNDIARTFDGKDVEMVLLNHHFDVYTSPEQAMSAVIQRQASEVQQTPSTQNRVSAITCDADTQQEFAVCAAPVYMIQAIRLSSAGWHKIVSQYEGREDGYLGGYSEDKALDDSGPRGSIKGLPVVIIGKDSVMDMQTIIPDTKSSRKFTLTVCAAASERINKIKEDIQQKYFPDVLHQQNTEERPAPVASPSIHASSEVAQRSNPSDAVITHWYEKLQQMPEYQDFASQLLSAYKHNMKKFHEDKMKDTTQSAYTALHSVFSKLQTFACKRQDIETASIAKEVADMSKTILDDTKRYTQEEAQIGFTTMQSQADTFGLYIPEI